MNCVSVFDHFVGVALKVSRFIMQITLTLSLNFLRRSSRKLSYEEPTFVFVVRGSGKFDITKLNTRMSTPFVCYCALHAC